jgi:hypothetical protein
MRDQVVSFETAKLAKEKGFKIPSHSYYFEDGEFKEFKIDDVYSCDNNTKYFETYSAPTQSILQKWLREEYGIHLVIIPTITSDWTFKTVKVLSKLDNDVIAGVKSVSDLPPYKDVHGVDFQSYEDALEAGLRESLKSIAI